MVFFLSTAGINKASDKLHNFSVFNRLWRQTVLQNLYKNTLRFIEILSSKNPIFYWSVDLFNFAFVVYGEFKTYQLHFRIQWGKELWIQLQPKVSFYPRWRRFPLHLSTYTLVHSMHFISRTHTLSSYFITEMCCVKRKYANGESLAWDIMTVGAHVWQRTVERGEMMGNINVGRFTLSLLIVSVKYTIRSKCV